MFKKLFVIFSIFLTACSWHFRNNEMLPEELRVIHFQTADPHSEVARALRTQLIQNDVKLVPASTKISTLRLNSARTESRVASVFKHAREAEKILSLTLSATVTVPNKGNYPLEVKLHRTFFDDSRAALAKSSEREMIMQQMYEQASHQLIIKMAGLHTELTRPR